MHFPSRSISSAPQLHLFSKGALPDLHKAHLVEFETLHAIQSVILKHYVPAIFELEDFLHSLFSVSH